MSMQDAHIQTAPAAGASGCHAHHSPDGAHLLPIPWHHALTHLQAASSIMVKAIKPWQ